MFAKPALFAAAASAIFSAPAFAADMPVYNMAPTAAAPAPYFYDWTGIYAGLHAGYFWGDVEYDGFGFGQDGFVLGGQVGANWQIDQFIIGIEGDISWSNADGSAPLAIPGATISSEMDFMATLRGRAGIAIDNILIYGTGGVAFANNELTVNSPLGSVSDDQTHTGWTVGAGVEAAVTETLTVKLEYLYVDFGDETYTTPAAVAAGLPPVSPDLDSHIVRAGLNYNFNLFQ